MDIGSLFVQPKTTTKKELVFSDAQIARAQEAIEACREHKKTATYGNVFAYINQDSKESRKWSRGAAKEVATLFERIEEGTSAFLVNKKGEYGSNAPKKEHLAFLAKEEFPEDVIKAALGLSEETE